MKCAKCGVTFNASKKAQLGFRDFDCVEVKVKCPSCNDDYYSLAYIWSREADANKLIKAERKKAAR